MNNKIHITVTGQPKIGKSKVCFLIKNLLRQNGFEVDFDLGVDFESEQQFDQHFDRILNNDNQTQEVVLREARLTSTKHELLLSDQAIDQHEMVKKLSNSNGASAEAIAFMVGMRKARELYEQARAKDAELIQKLVDCLHGVATLPDRDADERSTVARPGLEAAASAGFKPSEE